METLEESIFLDRVTEAPTTIFIGSISSISRTETLDTAFSSNSFYIMSSSMEEIVLKNLRRTDIETRLTIPRKSLNSFPPFRGKHMVDFIARDESDHVWKFRIYTRKNSKYLKPVLTKGWREFARRKELRVGDRVAFYKVIEQVGAITYRVEVQKPVEIFGAVIYHIHKPIHGDMNPIQNQETILATRDHTGFSSNSSYFMSSSMEDIALKNLTKTDIEKRLTIPTKFLNRFPPLNGNHMVDFKVRDEDGRIWKFRICTRKNNKYLKPVLTKGWQEFVRSKELRVGDRVAFCKENEQAGAVQSHVEVQKAVKIFIGSFSSISPTESLDTGFSSNSSNINSTETLDTGFSSNSFCFMSSSMEEIASKNLRMTDIEKRLTIPTKSLNRFPPLSGKHMVDFKVRDEDGRIWKFRIYTRKNNKYLKPVLTKGWREFARCKELRVGDRVAFYRENEQAGAVKCRVQVQKPIRIFGTVIYHKPIHIDTNPVQNQETILSTREQGRPKRSNKAPAWTKDFAMGSEPKPSK